ncbi:MAG: FecR domain-containing protein [Bacteroidota bacterium]
MNDHYHNYSILDFSQEDSFIRWVRQGDAQAAAFWESWLAEHPEKAADVQAARQLVQAIQIQETPHPPQQVDRIWSNIAREVEVDATLDTTSAQQAPTKVRSISRWWPYVAAAASVVFILLFLLPWGNSTQEMMALNGEQKTYYLPDSSKVTLNAGSRVMVNLSQWTKERKLELEGEAFFEVRKGSRFTVSTANGMVAVLGTSFNVNARAGELLVDCFTGKVKVSSEKASSEVILTPLEGTKLTAGANTWENYELNPSRQATWRDGMFYYNDTPLIKVFAELERQFNLRIDVEEREYLRNYTGFFDRRHLDKAFNSVCYPMGLTYERKGAVVYLTKRKE